jgi:hypothetical protein
MSEVSERRKKPRHKSGRSAEPAWVLLDIPGIDAEVRAKVVDTNELGLGVETECRLEPNALLTIDEPVPNHGNGKTRARVVDCESFHGVFRSGLIFEIGNGTAAAPPKRSRIITNCCRSAPMPIPT